MKKIYILTTMYVKEMNKSIYKNNHIVKVYKTYMWKKWKYIYIYKQPYSQGSMINIIIETLVMVSI